MNLDKLNQASIIRLAFAVVLIFIEVLFLSVLVDARTLPSTTGLSRALAESGNFLRWAVVTAGLFILFIAFNRKTSITPLTQHYSWTSSGIAFLGQLILYTGLVFVTVKVFGGNQVQENYYSSVWLVLVSLTFVSWCLIIAAPGSWKRFIRNQYKSLLIAGICGAVIVTLGLYFQQYWKLLTEFTLGSTHQLLTLIYDDIVFDYTQRKIGLEGFWVFVDASCSGIEGIVLAAATTSVYLFLTRHYLKFPHALLLVPLACLISIGLNIVRITALIILGAEVSPALAIGGFHSVAGWIAAVLVALLIIFLFSTWSWFQKPRSSTPVSGKQEEDGLVALAILIPFVLFLGVTLVLQIFTDGFDYLYPGKVLIAAIALGYFWQRYEFAPPARLYESVIAGLLVAVAWILLMPENSDQDLAFAAALSDMSPVAAMGWGVFRLAGFIIIAPILEELVFRGYLLCRLSGSTITLNTSIAFSVSGFLGSSILFGLIHSNWVAGFAAGLLFALVRYRGGTMTSCIVAHATANILVLAWAASTGRWSLI